MVVRAGAAARVVRAADPGDEGVGGDWGPDGEPVLILDDVFAELDARRRDRLAELVAPARQVLITAAVPDDVPAPLAGRARRRHGRRGGSCPLSELFPQPEGGGHPAPGPRRADPAAAGGARRAGPREGRGRAARVPAGRSRPSPAPGPGGRGDGRAGRARPAARRLDGQRPARPAGWAVRPGRGRAQAPVGGARRPAGGGALRVRVVRGRGADAACALDVVGDAAEVPGAGDAAAGSRRTSATGSSWRSRC